MKSVKQIIILLSIMLLTACATVNPYKPSGTGGFVGNKIGYKEDKIRENKWLVSYIGGIGAKESDTWKYLDQRANEFGQQQCNGKYQVSNEQVKDKYDGYGNILNIGTAIVICK